MTRDRLTERERVGERGGERMYVCLYTYIYIYIERERERENERERERERIREREREREREERSQPGTLEGGLLAVARDRLAEQRDLV